MENFKPKASEGVSHSMQEAQESVEKLINNFNIESLPEETTEEYISRILSGISRIRINENSNPLSILEKKINYAGRSVNKKVIHFFESSDRLKKFKKDK